MSAAHTPVPVPVADEPLGVDDYAITPAEATWLREAPREEMGKLLDELDYAWNMHGQEDERERALMNAISDRLDELHGGES